MDAANCVALTKVVVRADPAQATAAPGRKPPPFTVSENVALPAIAVAGESAERVGRAGAGLIVKESVLDRSPVSVLTAATGTVPAVAMKLAGMEAVSCVALTTVVAAILLPFHSICEPVR
jgi:hypothetical protein